MKLVTTTLENFQELRGKRGPRIFCHHMIPEFWKLKRDSCVCVCAFFPERGINWGGSGPVKWSATPGLPPF